MKFTFICDDTENTMFGGSKITYEFNDVTLDKVLDHLASFLRGCGYLVGYLEEVKDDEKSN